jgi:hypothetical protein
MKKYIITTTINAPTIALCKFFDLKDWTVIVIGDLKTPHQTYASENCIYLSPQQQEQMYKELSDILGWNTIQRRNIGLLHAYNLGADVVATVDDDNIPYTNWGKNLMVGNGSTVDYYDSNSVGVFDPLSVTNHNNLWHRGFPIQRLKNKNDVAYLGKKYVDIVHIQADLWDGDPDIDAMCRLTQKPLVKFDINDPYTSNNIMPFNSQNTFLSRDVLKYYMMIPFVGRMDDIWGAYLLQKYMKCNIIFNKASVYQERNPQDLITNLEKEILGYRHTDDLITGKYNLPEKSQKAYEIYQSYF